MSLLVLRGTDLDAFGYFTLAMGAYILGLNLARAAVGTPLLLSERAQQIGAGGLMLAVVVGTALALVGSPLVLLLPAEHRHVGFLMALALPFALLQDGQRFASFAHRVPRRAACLDGTWLVVMLALALVGVDPMLAWAAGAVLSSALGAAAWRLLPKPASVRPFLATTRFWRGGLLAEAGGKLVVLQLSPYLVAVVVGVAGFGALRAAYTVVAPIGLVVSGVAPILLVTYLQRAREHPETLSRLVATNAAGFGVVSAVYVAFALCLPGHILVTVFGPTVLDVMQLVLPIGVTMALLAAFCTVVDALRGLLAPRAVAAVRVIAGCSEPAAMTLGGALAGVVGAAVGSAAGMFVALAAVIAVFLRARPASRPRIVRESEPR